MKRILIIEDNADVADIFAQIIEISGHQPAIARDVPEGLNVAATWQPQLVLCDLGLPGDGLNFARACKKDPLLRTIKLLAVSGRSRPEDRQAAIEAGFDDLLGKPVDFATLQAVCEAA
jgi:CheY-like chemotaxis protein